MNSIKTVIKNFYGMKLKKCSNEVVFLSTILIEYISILVAEKISLIIQHSLLLPNGEFFLSNLYFYIIIPFIFSFCNIIKQMKDLFFIGKRCNVYLGQFYTVKFSV